MSRLEDAFPILISVVLRKSIYIFQELACLLADVASIMSSAIGYYSLSTRRSMVVSSRVYSFSYSPMPSMDARHDR